MIKVNAQLRLALDQVLELFPGGMNAPSSVEGRRKLIGDLLAAIPQNEAVDRQDFRFSNFIDESSVEVRMYTPKTGLAFADSVLMVIHGGGMIMGSVDLDDANASQLCQTLGVRVMAVDYRLAPEHVYPAQINDCYSAFRWLCENSTQFDIDPKNIVLFGGSAGGGLALGTALFIRDRGEINFSAIMAAYPMLDDRNESVSTHEILELGVWDRAANIESWNWYLYGNDPAPTSTVTIDSYAAPARATTLANLPPIFIDVGSCDLFRDEDQSFAGRLQDAGNLGEFHLYEGAFHASELFAPEADLSVTMWAKRYEVLRTWLS